MKKYTLLYSAVVALALVSCDYNEDNFDISVPLKWDELNN